MTRYVPITTGTVTTVENVRKGNVIDFVTYVLRIDTEPVRDRNWIRLSGRTSVGGCPTVHKAFLIGTLVNVRKEPTP